VSLRGKQRARSLTPGICAAARDRFEVGLKLTRTDVLLQRQAGQPHAAILRVRRGDFISAKAYYKVARGAEPHGSS